MASFSDLVSGDIPVVIDFYADWCAPCRMMPSILKEVKNTKGDQVRILKIDVDKNPKLAAKYGIRNIPTLMIFQNGKSIWRKAGVAQAGEILSSISK